MSFRRAGHIPRPVADLPLQELLDAVEDLAKDWAVSLISSLPLKRASEIPLSRLADQAPDLCACVLRSLTSDAELERLSAEGAATVGAVGELAGARDLAAAIAAVESLRTVLWERMIDVLHKPSAQQISELASRLSYVCSLITTAVLSREGSIASPPLESRGTVAPLSRSAPEASDPHEPQIEIHDARREGPAAWIRSIGSSLQEHARDGLPFVVALIEVVGIERLRHTEDPSRLGPLAGEVQEALRGELRPTDVLTRESEGRYWLLTSDTDASGARMLAERLIATVRDSVTHRGAPIEVAIGIATCPEDGREAAELAAHADMKLFAARAAGLSLAAPGDLIGDPDLCA
jgi:GGDEF domain-containing protein